MRIRAWCLVFVLVLARVAAAQQLVGPFAKDEYPRALIDRPLTLPAGMVEGELGATFTSIRLGPNMFQVRGVDEWTADVALRVGVTDWLQLEAGTAFSLDYVQRQASFFQGTRLGDIRPTRASWKHVVPFRLSLLALDTEALDTAVTLTLPFVAHASREFNFGRGGSVEIGTPGGGRVLPALELAAPMRWRLTDCCGSARARACSA